MRSFPAFSVRSPGDPRSRGPGAWNPGDEIIVSRLDHDANVSPWELAARDAGAAVQYIEVRPDDCTLDLDSLRSALSERTRLVAVGDASNLVGARRGAVLALIKATRLNAHYWISPKTQFLFPMISPSY